MSSTSATDFTRTAIALHWIAAALIVGNLAFGLYMVDLPLTPAKLRVLLLAQVGGRHDLPALRRAPAVAAVAPRARPARRPCRRWQRTAANASHHLLYLLFFAAPLSGWLFSSAAGFQTVYLGVVPDARPARRRTRKWRTSSSSSTASPTTRWPR